MSQHNPMGVLSFKPGETLSAGLVVGLSAAKTVTRHLTSTSNIIGVVLKDADSADNNVSVVSLGSVKCLCSASISAGAIVGPATASGQIVARPNSSTVTTASLKTLGVALEAGSANQYIEVLLSINNEVINSA